LGLRWTPGVIEQAVDVYIPAQTVRNYSETMNDTWGDNRITESQNSRGWKGPLWVI